MRRVPAVVALDLSSCSERSRPQWRRWAQSCRSHTVPSSASIVVAVAFWNSRTFEPAAKWKRTTCLTAVDWEFAEHRCWTTAASPAEWAAADRAVAVAVVAVAWLGRRCRPPDTDRTLRRTLPHKLDNCLKRNNIFFR